MVINFICRASKADKIGKKREYVAMLEKGISQSTPRVCRCLSEIAQNWKHLLKNTVKTALTVIVSMLVVTLVAFVLFGGAFRLLDWSGFMAFVLAVMLAWSIKFAFIDSWMMVICCSSLYCIILLIIFTYLFLL